MIEFSLIILCFLLLGLIFYRRFKLLGEGETIPAPPPPPSTQEEHVDEVAKDPQPKNTEIDLGQIKIILWKAQRHFDSGALEEAEKAFSEVLALDEEHVDAMSKLGLIYLKRDVPEKAEKIYKKLSYNFPNEACYFSNLGLALYTQKKLAEALEVYQIALQLDNTRAARFISLAHVLRELGKIEEAIANVKRAIEFEKSNIDYLLLLAELYKLSLKEGEHSSILNLILEMDPGNAAAKEMLGE